MPKLNKVLLTASLLLMSAAASGSALAKDNDHRGPWGNGSQGRDYGYNDHDHHDQGWDDRDWNRHDDRWDRHGYDDRTSWRNAFDLHVPKRLKGSRARLPLLIVVDSRGTYRGMSSERFYREKAAREGFILAYTYSKNSYGYRRNQDDIIRSVLGLLDGHYRVNTNRINVRYD